MAKSDIWNVLSSKESSSLSRLRAQLEATQAEQERLILKMADIDVYIEEYSTRSREASSDGLADFRVLHHSMNLISQLSEAKQSLSLVYKGLEENVVVLRNKITHHEMERLKFNKIGERNREKVGQALEKRSTALSDAMALQQFVSSGFGR